MHLGPSKPIEYVTKDSNNIKTKITEEDHEKDLGVIFWEKINFNAHIFNQQKLYVYVYGPSYVSSTVQSLSQTIHWVCLSMGTQVVDRFKSKRKRAEACNQISSTNKNIKKLLKEAKKNRTTYH